MTAKAIVPDEDTAILSIREAAGVLRCGVNVVYELVKQPGFPSFKIGSNWRIPRQALDQWILEQAGGES